jgi:tetratricopeptide (TPR) repeat protein
MADLQSLFSSAVEKQRQKEYAQAEALYRQCHALDGSLAHVQHNLGVVLDLRGRSDEADQWLKQSLMTAPNDPVMQCNYGAFCIRQRRYEDAIKALERSLELRPGNAETLRSLGAARQRAGRFNEAIEAFEEAGGLKPQWAEVFLGLGLTYQRMGEFDRALSLLNEAVRLRPDWVDAQLSVGLTHLLEGDLTKGWPGYEWRWKRKEYIRDQRDYGAPMWNGQEPDRKTILVHSEQGYGDEIHFARYLPLLADRGAKVVLECSKPTVPLFRTVRGIGGVIVRGEPFGAIDYFCPAIHLARVFGTELATIPSHVPYLSCDPAKAKHFAHRMKEHRGLKVGVGWAGTWKHANDYERSIRPEVFAEIGCARNITFYSVQKNDGTADRVAMDQSKLPLIDWTGELADFSDTAALMANLDLVVSVDTSIVHLAGALARPVWTLLAFAPDWRWMRDREDSPWYPTMRLFRQPTYGDWKSVIERVTNELSSLAVQT